MVFQEFTHSRFTQATFIELQSILAELQRTTIRSQLPTRRDPQIAELEAVKHFHQAVEQVCERLREAGHDIYRLDYDGNVHYDHNSQLWGTDFQDGNPHGLEIEFRPDRVVVVWVVGPQRASGEIVE